MPRFTLLAEAAGASRSAPWSLARVLSWLLLAVALGCWAALLIIQL